MLFEILLLLFGFILISWSADKFVDGAAALARKKGISPLLIGLTIVALGTSAPEIFVSIASAYSNNLGIAIGNVLGSNIANVALVLGLCATIKPLRVHSKILKREYPILFFITFILWILLRDNYLSRFDGLIFLICLISLIAWFTYVGLKNKKDHLAEEFHDEIHHEVSNISIELAVLYLIFGIILLPISSHIIVHNAVAIATFLGVSDLVIGLTIIAIGTSLPEVMTAISATLKNEHDILLGNIIGSNLFNIAAVLPFPAFINPSFLSSDIQRDVIMVCITTVLLLIFGLGFKGKGTITRIEGIALLVIYASYMGYLILSST